MTGKYLIKAIGFANGVECPHENQFLKAFDHDAYNGRGFGEFTDSIDEAMKFDSHEAVMAFWNKQSTVKPRRPDGRPNKPLTALTIVIEQLVLS